MSDTKGYLRAMVLSGACGSSVELTPIVLCVEVPPGSRSVHEPLRDRAVCSVANSFGSEISMKQRRLCLLDAGLYNHGSNCSSTGTAILGTTQRHGLRRPQ